MLAVAVPGCTRDEPRTTPAVTSSAPTASSAPIVTSASPVASAPPAAQRCLPVVAADCGCVYSCGSGRETAPGKWNVTHPFWATHALEAKVAPWCVSGDCTDAFHAQIVCSAVCAPKPADHTCHFEGDRCVSGQKP